MLYEETIDMPSIATGKTPSKVIECFRFSLFILLIMALFIRNVTAIDIPMLVFLGLFGAIAVYANKTWMLALVVSCIPLSTLFQYKYAILIVMLVYLVKYRIKLKSIALLLLLVLMGIWELLHGFVGEFTFVEYLRTFTELIFITLILSNISDSDDIDYVKIVRILSISTLSVCIIVLCVYIKNNGIGSLISATGSNRFGYGVIHFSGFNASYNPNILGGICIFAVSTLFQIMIKKQNNLIDIVILIMLCIFSLLTLSRMVIISMVIIFLIYLIMSRNIIIFIRRLFLTVIILSAMYLLIKNYFPDTINNIILRFTVDDISNGRLTLIKDYNQFFLNNSRVFLFGVGIQDFYTKLVNTFKMHNVAHNFIQELIAVWGIIGTAIFTTYTIFLFKRSKGKHSVITYYPFISLLMFVLNDQFITNGKFLLMFAMGFVSYYFFDTKKVNRQAKNNQPII